MVIPQFLLVSLLYHKWIMVAKFGNNENFRIKSLTLLIRIVIIKKIKEDKKMTFDYSDKGKEPLVIDMEGMTLENENYRTTLWTGDKIQLTVMSIQPGDDIGLEVHHGVEQFLRIESGQGLCQMGPSEDKLDFEAEVGADQAIFVPAGVWHNVTNTGDEPLKLYTIYGGPDHLSGTVHPSHDDARNDPNEH
jgi:mannose-6-phosphate isomerase-like protein (cupin superfamily)